MVSGAVAGRPQVAGMKTRFILPAQPRPWWSRTPPAELRIAGGLFMLFLLA